MKRASGILLHISSLPSRHGIGTLGLPAYEFASFLKKSGQSYWQVLPLGPTGAGWSDSPYMSFSSFAGNPNFIDLDTLTHQGYLTEAELFSVDFGQDAEHVDFDKLNAHRMDMLRLAFSRIRPETEAELDAFMQEHASWLEDYCLYMALREENNELPWCDWEEPIRMREEEALREAKLRLRDTIRFHAFLQMLFRVQWGQLRYYLKELGIRVIGDLPIYVPYDSADVWADPDMFLLDERCRPEVISGVPPDYFSEDGQLWGHPIYNWDAMWRDNYKWWRRRMAAQAELFDVVRIDHFRALASYWTIPYGEKTAKNGRWNRGPGIEFVRMLQKEFPDTQFIAEDLGLLTDDVIQLLEESGLPGMKVLEFAFTPGANSAYLPHNHVKNCVVYVGTHDNMTAAQWLEEEEEDAAFAKDYLGEATVEELLRVGYSSVADLFVSTMQDWLGLGAEARMNTPSTVGNNWNWRIKLGDFNDELAARIRKITERYARI
ncbi:MAG: 4-alpha-glucanotransferase [Clostridia bacterium]|nr:4-alpha-glucanotransferase [Clostridia bacterium]